MTTAEDSLSVRLLTCDDVVIYLDLVCEVEAGSGVNGEGHAHPYSRSEIFDPVAGRDREAARWSTPIDVPGWRRAWGLFDRNEIVGYLNLAGGELRSELHRAEMGMGIARPHRRRGGGGQLLHAAIGWARQQTSIDWIDLGVFSDNPGAQALYVRHGFHVIGRAPDRYRIDGQSVDDTSMTLNVSDVGA